MSNPKLIIEPKKTILAISFMMEDLRKADLKLYWVTRERCYGCEPMGAYSDDDYEGDWYEPCTCDPAKYKLRNKIYKLKKCISELTNGYLDDF